MARFSITVNTPRPGTERNEYPEPGSDIDVSGETLEDLRSALAAMGYQGGDVRVRDVAGFTAGYVSARDWRAV